MGRLIAVTSGKGGVGKSSVSVQLAAALGGLGHHVLLVDLDAGMRCLDILLNLSDRLVFDLNDVLNAEQTVDDAVLAAPGHPGVSFLAAPLKSGIDPARLAGFLVEAGDRYDFVLLDFPAGGVGPLYSALPRYTEALVVCNADTVSVRDAATVARDLAGLRLMSVRLILNRVSFDTMRRGVTANIDEVIDHCGLQLIGVIPQSMEVYLSGCTGQPLKAGSRPAKAFHRLAKRLLGYDIPLQSYKKI